VKNFTQNRHRPLYAGDPICFSARKKMGRPDKPGDDGSRVGKLKPKRVSRALLQSAAKLLNNTRSRMMIHPEPQHASRAKPCG
jgi:hypothetical protein